MAIPELRIDGRATSSTTACITGSSASRASSASSDAVFSDPDVSLKQQLSLSTNGPLWLHPLHGDAKAHLRPLRLSGREFANGWLERKASAGLPPALDLLHTAACCIKGSAIIISGRESASLELDLLFASVRSYCGKGQALAVIAVSPCSGIIALESRAAESESDFWAFVCEAVLFGAVLRRLGTAGALRRDLDAFCTLEVEQIGEGSYSKVYVGRMLGTRRHVVAKILNAETPLEVMTREVQMLVEAQDCENVISFFGVFLDKTWTVTLEYAATGDLCEFIMRKIPETLSEHEGWHIGGGILKALRHLHALRVPIIHRDVKIDNILLTIHSAAKLSDFGLACHITDDEAMAMRCGSPGYIAPEIILDQDYDEKVDCFSAGVVIYCMLSGTMPFTSTEVRSTLKRTIKCRVDFHQPSWATIRNEAKVVVAGLLTREAQGRMSSAEALQQLWFQQAPDATAKEQLYDDPLSPLTPNRNSNPERTFSKSLTASQVFSAMCLENI